MNWIWARRSWLRRSKVGIRRVQKQKYSDLEVGSPAKREADLPRFDP